MRAHLLSLFLLTLVAFSLATTLEPWFQSWAGSRTQSDNVLQVALGDSRRMFARHFYTKADAYFHNGYYPSIFDSKAKPEAAQENDEHEGHDEHADHAEGEQCEGHFLGGPTDWLDRFSRNFYASRHTHLGDSDCGTDCCPPARAGKGHAENCPHKDHDHEHEHAGEDAAPKGLEREILPWIRLSAEMDPQRVETYVVAAFWLRAKIKNVDAAEQFLREGLRANPGDPEILFALGSIYFEERKDMDRGRNVLELAQLQWREREVRKPEPNTLLLGQILNQLALLERQQKNFERAIQHYTQLKEVSPSKQSVQEWIDALKTNLPPAALKTAQ